MTATFDESRVRHPKERPVFIATVLLNLALVAGALALGLYGGDWLERHPRVATYADGLRVTAIAAVLAPFALTFARNRRHAAVRANSAQLSRAQFPEIYQEFEQMCATLGMQPPPELYLSDDAIKAPSVAYSAWHVDYVVLDEKFLDANLPNAPDVYRFFLARELGRIRLGHTRWLDDILIAHVTRTPRLANPLMHMRTYSHDRVAMTLAPDSIRGLAVLAVGHRMLNHLDVETFLTQARAVGGWWARVASLGRDSPRVAYRVQELERAGLLPHGTAIAVPRSGPTAQVVLGSAS
jgi:hypothetical protein